MKTAPATQHFHIVNNPVLLRRLVQEACKHADRNVQIKLYKEALQPEKAKEKK